MQFDSEKPDKITRGACNDDKVIFENPLNWTTRSFIFAKQREYENGPATPEPSGETIVRGRDRGKRKEAELYAPDPGSKIIALVLGWVEDSASRSGSQAFGVAGSSSKYAFASILW